MQKWRAYFGDAELPFAFYYTDQPSSADPVRARGGHRCLFADLAKVRKGQDLCFEAESIGCHGGKKYLGFSKDLMPNFEFFLSCGIPGSLEGERYKKTPELVTEYLKRIPDFTAPARFIVFKRWDRLDETDLPEAVVFFAPADVLSGLFTLANYDRADLLGVFSPFCAGCGAIVQYPCIEARSEDPRAVLGTFDVSARPFVPASTLSFAVPMKKFADMTANMDESFLITRSWKAVRRRMDTAG